MLRKGLVALMMGVICAGSAVAADSAPQKPNPAPTGLAGWRKNKTSGHHRASAVSKPAQPHKVGTNSKPKSGGVERAVVKDAERQSVLVRQTAGSPQDFQEPSGQESSVPPQSALRPVPVENAPVLPNISSVSGPQYFSAMPPGSSNVIPVHPGSNWQTYQAPMQFKCLAGTVRLSGEFDESCGTYLHGRGHDDSATEWRIRPDVFTGPVSTNRSSSVSVTDSRHSAANGRSRHNESGVPSARNALSARIPCDVSAVLLQSQRWIHGDAVRGLVS